MDHTEDMCSNVCSLFLFFRCDFTGTLIVVPDVGSLNMPGARSGKKLSSLARMCSSQAV